MEFRDLVDQIKTAAADGLTLPEVGQILGGFSREVVIRAEQLSVSGPSKKSLVMRWVEEAVDVLVPAIPLPVWLVPFGPIVRRVAKTLLVAIADGLVESAVKLLPQS